MFLSDPGFIIGADYNRAPDIHDRFGGSRQSGIAPSAQAPFVFLFTGDSGQQYGYEDGWQGDGIFTYTGEGQNGDMQFTRGNKAIRDHAEDGKDLLLFEQLGKGRGVRFLGPFACASWEYGRGPDVSGNDRQTIRFHLVRVTTGPEAPPLIEPVSQPTIGIEELRSRAYAAADAKRASSSKEARRQYRERSEDVKRYVLARANGICELTGRPAPFHNSKGEPFLARFMHRGARDGAG